MMNLGPVFDFPEAKAVVISGDIHGQFNELVFKCCVQYGMTDTVIIVAGDCGFGFEQPGYYENVYNRNRGRLSKSNNWILFVRGNHDNPAYFNDYPIKHRKKDEPLARNIYWANEYPVFEADKLDAINKDFAIDTIVTHIAPSFCELTSKGGLFAEMAIRDEDLTEDVKNERQVMDRILDHLSSNHHPLRYWFYGHFHQSWQAIDNEGIQYNMLDIMEVKELRAKD